MVGAVKPNFVPLESESANVPKCAQVHGVPTSRIANVKHGPESCLVEAVKEVRREKRRKERRKLKGRGREGEEEIGG